MLVISRKAGESIRIGDDVVVRVAKTSSGKVSLVLDAPRDVSIVRAELLFDEERSPEQFEAGERPAAACP